MGTLWLIFVGLACVLIAVRAREFSGLRVKARMPRWYGILIFAGNGALCLASGVADLMRSRGAGTTALRITGLFWPSVEAYNGIGCVIVAALMIAHSYKTRDWRSGALGLAFVVAGLFLGWDGLSSLV